MTVIDEIATERKRQQAEEGFTPAHDEQWHDGQIATAAACYAMCNNVYGAEVIDDFWPWDWQWWKPAEQRRNLIKAGALIVAEIERLDRVNSGRRIEP